MGLGCPSPCPRDVVPICPGNLCFCKHNRSSLFPFPPTPGLQPSNAAVAEKGEGSKVPSPGQKGLNVVEGLQPWGSAAAHRGLLRRNALSSAACKAGQSQEPSKKQVLPAARTSGKVGKEAHPAPFSKTPQEPDITVTCPLPASLALQSPPGR